ncbi:tetratricopeptide repeat protein [Methylomagnum ishizawai]|uniref:tetratricopeptide repeat protein n=1 Tax=Methylomagnum ishizawai TaxID=1760988 RepID=UPI001C3375BC|nr:hypothetical protein [Methylomagnum ishizawai]BBL73680.1 hypothetical protein MishRS11D_07780 [Methylomagnum ishizawai]
MKKKHAKQIADAIALAEKSGEELHLSSYEITHDPMPSKKDKIPRQVKMQLEELNELVYTNPEQAIPRLLQLKSVYPKMPVLYNYLAAAYGRIGDHKSSRQLIVENYENNPDYLFAKVNYAQICLNEGEVDKVPEIFGNKFDLKMLYPSRNRFHVTEFAGFTGVMCAYYSSTGNKELAKLWYKSLKEVAPDSEMVKFAKSFVHPSILTRIRNWAAKKSRSIDQKLEQEKKKAEEYENTEGPHFEA